MNSFGTIFKVSLFGESHGNSVGVVIDNCPAGIPLTENDFTRDLTRRNPALKGTTERKEKDAPSVVSGLFNGFTTGSPLTIIFKNEDAISSDYEKFRQIPRPGHVDFAAGKKFNGFEDYRGGGHFSGRITVGLVAAGVVAKKILKKIIITASLNEVGGKENIEKAIDEAMLNNDSIGGIIECTIKNLPAGLGEPFFYSVESCLSHIVFSIPAIKGIEFGAGFKAADMIGSQHNDSIIDISGNTSTNHSGGIAGGLTNGNDMVFRVAVKPASGISKEQNTINLKTGKIEKLSVSGRHDACIALRMPVIIEAVSAIALTDLMMINHAVKLNK